jgi:hypothetical protein
MPFYEFEITIEELNELLKEKNEIERKSYEKHSAGMQERSQNIPKTPKMPNTSNYKMPSFKPPRF